ncbi:efflux transporter outer membrane subunit [Variovorax sp. HJSM1_2]|uniref:efflux transporter outer membrane subunit n=1 Tax=Variovorax sp. HJSM1_2 TaxID=3366263 RepID=UPI003BC9128C
MAKLDIASGRLGVIRGAYILPVALLAVLSGCTLGPDYQRPALDVPAQHRHAELATTGAVVDVAWWKQWGDPVLAALVDEALTANQDIAASSARVEQFYGSLGQIRGQLYPQIGADLGGTRSRASGRSVSPAPAQNPYSGYQADLTVSWEIDLFGRVRRLTEAAQADLQAAEEARRGVLLSVVAATASGYVTLRDLDNRLEVSRRTLASREAALKLFERRFRGGVISEVELSQARTEYARALQSVPQYEQLVSQQENALSLLLGRNPGPIARGLSIDQFQPPPVPAGLPSELLERRPDVRQAEQSLVAANARIGAAKALYFPRISLTGAFGSESSGLSNLWSGPARTWSYGGMLVAPIFTGGSTQSQVFGAEGAQREALALYRQSVQTAFREVDDALVGIRNTVQSRDAQKLQVDSTGRYAQLARRKYEGGYTSYLEVLDAERSQFSAELAYSQGIGDVLLQQIAMLKALGGSWVEWAEKNASPPRSLDVAESTATSPRQEK